MSEDVYLPLSFFLLSSNPCCQQQPPKLSTILNVSQSLPENEISIINKGDNASQLQALVSQATIDISDRFTCISSSIISDITFMLWKKVIRRRNLNRGRLKQDNKASRQRPFLLIDSKALFPATRVAHFMILPCTTTTHHLLNVFTMTLVMDSDKNSQFVYHSVPEPQNPALRLLCPVSFKEIPFSYLLLLEPVSGKS